MKIRSQVFALMTLGFGLASAAAIAQIQPIETSARFALVNNKELTAITFDQHARQTFRDRFYHGTPPEAEMNKMLREVGQNLIDRALLEDDVRTRQTRPDEEWVKGEAAKYDRRYSSNPQWETQRGELLPRLTAELELQSKIKVLEREIRHVKPDAAEVRAFYENNKNLFTEPAKHRISLILLKIDPSSPSSVWESKRQAAEELLARIKDGADFAKIAQEMSGDPSAAKGGDMGFIHQGMLSEQVEKQLETMNPGQLGTPARTLEGEVVFRLDEKIPASLRRFDEVEPRAKDLYVREQSEKNWQAFLVNLRAKGTIEIGPSFTEIMRPPVDATAVEKKP